MATSPVLHPAVRERREPRMSATALAEYLILTSEKQEKILHDSRYAQSSIVGANGDALRALNAYNCDPRRPQDALERVKAALMAKAASKETRPKSKDEALRCKEIIELFQRNENALGLRPLALSRPRRFGELDIEGVALSIQPDYLVSGGSGRVGLGILRVAKGPDPAAAKRDKTRLERGDHRREMARYTVAMLQMLLDANGDLGTPDRDLCFVADLRIAERIGPAADHTARLQAIRAACRQIVRLWPTITPQPHLFKKS